MRFFLLAAALLFALPAAARRSRRGASSRSVAPRPLQDPSHWFAMHPGLLRVYEERAKPGKAQDADAQDDAPPPAGASCEGRLREDRAVMSAMAIACVFI